MFRRSSAILATIVVIGAFIWISQARRSTDNPRPEIDAQPRLVILFAPCTVNRNYLSPYDSEVSYTPHLDWFAERSVIFTDHYTEAGQSGTAYASLFSGNQAFEHGIYRHPEELSDESYLIAEAYADAGYETYYFTAHGMASPELNYDQGVEKRNTFVQRPLTGNDPDFLEILDRLESDPSQRAFVYTNFHVTHGLYKTINFGRFLRTHWEEANGISRETLEKCTPFTRPRECNLLWRQHSNRLRFDFPRALEQLSESVVEEVAALEELIYKSNVNRLDSMFGSMIGQLGLRGLLDESLIAFTADHGEVLFREGAILSWDHGPALDPEVLRVPMIVYGPGLGIDPGRYTGVSRSIDVFPTLFGLSGLGSVEEMGVQGVDLSQSVLGSREPPEVLAYSHSTIIGPRREGEARFTNTLLGKLYPEATVEGMWVSVASEDMVFKWRSNVDGGWRFEAFDRSDDPFQRNDVFDEDNPVHREMAERLRSYKKLLVDSYHAKIEEAPLNEEELELLRSLGYVD